jgi:tetratricopeptide (TPR) repeat protein
MKGFLKFFALVVVLVPAWIAVLSMTGDAKQTQQASAGPLIAIDRALRDALDEGWITGTTGMHPLPSASAWVVEGLATAPKEAAAAAFGGTVTFAATLHSTCLPLSDAACWQVDQLDVPSVGPGAYLGSAANAQRVLNQIDLELKQAIAERNVLRQELASIPETLSMDSGGSSGPPSHNSSRVLEAENKLKGLLSRYTEIHPDVIAAQLELDELLAETAESSESEEDDVGSLPNPRYQDLKLRLKEQTSRISSLQKKRRAHGKLVGEQMLIVQEQLRQLDLDPGPADGVFGLQTRQAVAAYIARAGDDASDERTTRALVELEVMGRLARGTNHHADGDHHAALREYAKVLELDPHNTRAHVNRGLAYQEMGMLDLAIQEYGVALEHQENQVMAYQSLGNAYFETGNYWQGFVNHTNGFGAQYGGEGYLEFQHGVKDIWTEVEPLFGVFVEWAGTT